MSKLGRSKVLVVANFSADSGTERMASSVLKSMSQEFEVVLIAAETKGLFFKSISQNISSICCLSKNSKKGAFYSNAFRIWLQILFFRPCALLVYNYQLGLATGLALRFTPKWFQPKKRVLAHHISVEAVKSDREETGRMKAYFPMFSHHIVPSEALIPELKSVVSSLLIKVIPNGLNFDEVLLKSSEFNPYMDKPAKWHCVYVGGLREDKRIDKLLVYFSKLPERRNVHLTIVGDGDERSKLEVLAKSLGVHSECSFVGHIENPYPYVAFADILVQTSDWETFGLTILEAMLLKTVVLATQGYSLGLQDVIQDGVNGRLVAHENEMLFIQIWSDLLRSEEKRRKLVTQAWKDAQKFKEKCMSSGYLSLLECK